MTKCAGLSRLVVAATLVAATQAQASSSMPDNVSSKLMIHVSSSLYAFLGGAVSRTCAEIRWTAPHCVASPRVSSVAAALSLPL